MKEKQSQGLHRELIPFQALKLINKANKNDSEGGEGVMWRTGDELGPERDGLVLGRAKAEENGCG